MASFAALFRAVLLLAVIGMENTLAGGRRRFSFGWRGFGGIGHGPSKPKSHRATMEHNIEWFDQYLFQAAAKPSTEQR